MDKDSKHNKHETLNALTKRVSTLEELYEKMEKQQELLNEIPTEIRKNPRPSESLFSILEDLDLDMEKFIKMATFIWRLYTDSNEEKIQQKEAD
ncbi:hypothetical protein [Psychrobacillus psychrodurans]|uniref:hypothetical protein n=1 Tax=Psychrobacillus psychrodurans TaxID=126157 RepID=UPI003D06008D